MVLLKYDSFAVLLKYDRCVLLRFRYKAWVVWLIRQSDVVTKEKTGLDADGFIELVLVGFSVVSMVMSAPET